MNPEVVVIGLVLLGLAALLGLRMRPKRRGKRRSRHKLVDGLSRVLEPNKVERNIRNNAALMRDIERHQKATGETWMPLPDPNAKKRKG